jgi:hypothetical protein
MTNDEGSSKSELRTAGSARIAHFPVDSHGRRRAAQASNDFWASGFVILSSFVIRHSSFELRQIARWLILNETVVACV